MIRIILSFFLMTAALPALFGQNGGEGIFNFLQLTNSAKCAALGGIQVALPDPDPELLLQNPALLSVEMNNTISVNYAKYLAGIGYGYGAYAKDLGKFGMAAIGIQFVDYGQFVAADETGLITGSFSAADYALTITYAKKIGNHLTFGASLKPIYSHLENYRSFGIASDIGIVHHTTDKLTTIALSIKNLGAQIKSYYDGGPHENLIWSLQLGMTRKLQYAPVRYSITAYDLNRWSSAITATDPTGIDTKKATANILSDAMRHLSLGAEIFPEHKLTLRIGYNYRRAVDMAVTDQSSFSGFTTGLGINLRTIRFNYALSGYSLYGMVHNFSLTTNLSCFTQK